MPAAPQTSRRIRRTIAYSDDSKSHDPSSIRSLDSLVSDASYRETSRGLGNSQSSLGKRLASVVLESGPKDFAFLFEQSQAPAKALKTSASDCTTSASSAADCATPPGLAAPDIISDGDAGPKDFAFLFHQSHQTEKRLKTSARDCATSAGSAAGCVTSAGSAAPNVISDADGVTWVRTQIQRGSDLVDGQSWMQSFQERLANSAAKTNFAKGRILKDLAKVCPPGRKVKLATGQEVIFWFNVGRPGPLQKRVYVTEAKCPHQGVCLLTGELGEIEDAAGVARAVVRCPRHNKTFHLQTGHSEGNTEVLKTYPCQFKNGFWYVGVDNQEQTESAKPARAHAKCEADTQEKGIDVRKKLRVVLDAVGWREELQA